MRLLPRPEAARPCARCGDLAGRGYPSCRECEDLVEWFWMSDWSALLAVESAPPGQLVNAILADRTWRYPWTCVDWALRLSDCRDCGAELATGPRDCVGCAIADERRWALEDTASSRMSGNERSLRLARAVLRAPARHRSTMVSYWQLVIPFLLTGEAEGGDRGEWLRASLLAGRYRELAGCRRYTELTAMSELPWRDTGEAITAGPGAARP